MRDLSHTSREPGGKLRGGRRPLAENRGRELALQGLESGLGLFRTEPGKRSYRLTRWPMRHGELPAWRVPKLDGMLAKAHFPGTPDVR